MNLNNCVVLLSGYIEKDQAVIIRPISILFGYIMNFFFEVAGAFTQNHLLGISIIMLTIVTRCLMLPLGIKAQKSTAKMQALAPEIEKIKQKYGNSKDPEVQQKIMQETQLLYSKNNVNLLGGCLPLLIQMPLFIALNDIMRRSYTFINQLGDIYADLADFLLAIPQRMNYLVPLATPHVPNGMAIDLANTVDLQKVLNRFTSAEWNTLIAQVPWQYQNTLINLLDKKENMEQFLSINLMDNAGFLFPGILIPILSAVFMFASSYFMNKANNKNNPNIDPNTKMTQNVMTYVMPLVIGWTTASFPAGVGLYWTVSSAFQLVQQLLLSKFYKPHIESGKPEEKPKHEKSKIENPKKNDKNK